MVGIGPVDFVDEAKILFIVCRKSRRLGEHRDDLAAHRFPKHLNATHDRSGGTARLAEYVSGFKWTALSHIVSRALHRTDNLVREITPPGLAEGFGKITGFRGMAAVQEKPKQVRGVSKPPRHHLPLYATPLKQDFRAAYPPP